MAFTFLTLLFLCQFSADYSNRDSVDSEISDEEDVSDEDDGDSSFDSVEKQHPKGRTLAKKNAMPVTAKSTKPGEFSTNCPTTGDCLYILHSFSSRQLFNIA